MTSNANNSNEITVLNGAVRLLQPDSGFKTCIDSVLAAATCPAQGGDHVLDLGCGVGSIGFCLLQRVPETSVTGVELQSLYYDLALKNAVLNGMQDRAVFIKEDIIDFHTETRFDHVVCNPPYLEAGKYLQSPDPVKTKAIGHDCDEAGLEDWITAAHRHLKSKGSLTIIHRADMTDKIIRTLGRRFGAVEIIPFYPKAGQAARRVIIRARKDRQTPAILHPGMILHEEDGSYSSSCDQVLRNASSIY